MSKRGGGHGLVASFDSASGSAQDAEYVALVRLEGRDGFVEPGGVVRLAQASARVLLAAGLVMPGVGADDGPTVGADDDPPLRDDDPPIPTDAKAAEK